MKCRSVAARASAALAHSVWRGRRGAALIEKPIEAVAVASTPTLHPMYVGGVGVDGIGHAVLEARR